MLPITSTRLDAPAVYCHDAAALHRRPDHRAGGAHRACSLFRWSGELDREDQDRGGGQTGPDDPAPGQCHGFLHRVSGILVQDWMVIFPGIGINIQPVLAAVPAREGGG
jgi:hypothetical protein